MAKGLRRITIGGELYEYSDATKDVALQREMIDIWNGKRGKADACMNWHCVIRNSKLFSHPVLAVSVIKTRVFIITRPGTAKRIGHAVRYTIPRAESSRIGRHDAKGVAELGVLILRAPRGDAKSGADHGGGSSGPKNKTGKRDHPLAKGEKARLLVAVGAMNQST